MSSRQTKTKTKTKTQKTNQQTIEKKKQKPKQVQQQRSRRKKRTTIVSVKKKYLVQRRINSFLEWKKLPNTVYIGRNMSFYVEGATKSKWANPFTVKKYGRVNCLKKYEEYVRNSEELYNSLPELIGKELGCWCKPDTCHGDILIDLVKEYQYKQKQKQQNEN
ncbi:hypothetical protein M0812_15207 [Anaeramoeba flamelloides]|uniref:DUF4326 domain-containing protein n=1 Tax=Anaeramoeba flamelloides TaxID=1746091 RepID=A0AAV7ZBB7_9EUKA|nr:hypothetical protein M0812_15207 [Anaeramoeba flamelloides]